MKKENKIKNWFGKNKKSQSSIIVTVLLVLIGLVAVSLVAIWIIGFVRENTAFDNAHIELTIDPAKTFIAHDFLMGSENPDTIWEDDSTMYESVALVKVSRISGNAQLAGIKFIFTRDNGKTRTLITKFILGELESRTYYLKDFTDSFNYNLVEIAPIVQINGKERTLDVVARADLKSSSIIPDLAVTTGFVYLDESGTEDL